MRFLPEGPSIPDALLTARDEGRVVFFCGAGVSRAYAGLSDFFGLADEVISMLAVRGDSPVRAVLELARSIKGPEGVGGLISADRIFGLLEREFDVADIESAVAKALRPKARVNLSAHQILLDLARTQDGKTRLVTTNFDRLFSECDPNLKQWHPPRLPSPSRPEEMNGITHLHGLVNDAYDGAAADGFILSSADFGRAYLSEGWATSFIREILERYVVVFVGYSADDPPVQYLLEALNKRGQKLSNVYAFQAGEASTAVGMWLQKGVEAIPFSPNDNYEALWKTLEAWAGRTASPEDWQKAILDLAQKGPAALSPHERGMVAHLVSTQIGAAKFSGATPPAEWLCVFDPTRRYAMPKDLVIPDDSGQVEAPFQIYGIDSDAPPSKVKKYERNGEAIAQNAERPWDALALNRIDLLALQTGRQPTVRGVSIGHQTCLPPRVWQLGTWISKTSHHQACLWWACRSGGLHPEISRLIEHELEYSATEYLPHVREAWGHLLRSWRQNSGALDLDWYRFKVSVKKHGWNGSMLREFASVCRPHIKVEPAFGMRNTPPEQIADTRLSDFLNIDVAYGENVFDIEVPDQWLERVIAELRKNLEIAIDLETELSGYGLNDLPLLVAGAPVGDANDRAYGLSAYVTYFVKCVERLIALDIASAKRELNAWSTCDETVFARLRIWATTQPALVSAEDAGVQFLNLGNSAFWSEYHQPDLLRALAQRWKDFQPDAHAMTSQRLLDGPVKDTDDSEDVEFSKYSARASLNRLHWLSENGCTFRFDLSKESSRLQAIAENWSPSETASAVEGFHMRGGWVQTKTEHDALLSVPLATLLGYAEQHSGRGTNFLEESDPFAGLCTSRPVRALNALTYEAKQGRFPAWAWRKFLYSEFSSTQKPKFFALIAARLASYRADNLAGVAGPVTSWLKKNSLLLAEHFPKVFSVLTLSLIRTIALHPKAGGSNVIRGDKTPDWVTEALNAPSGMIAQALMNDQHIKSRPDTEPLNGNWLEDVASILALPDDNHRYALAIFTFNLNWFFARSPEWTCNHLLSAFDDPTSAEFDAAWSGLLSSGRLSSGKLFTKLKPKLLSFSISGIWTKRGYSEALAAMVLRGWASVNTDDGKQYVSDTELRDLLRETNEEFRIQIAWLAEQWAKKGDDSSRTHWLTNLLRLIKDVWPRDLTIKTPKMSACLCNLAFSNPAHFADIALVVLPLVNRAELDHLHMHGIHLHGEEIATAHPELTLALLFAVLPEDAKSWPYEVDKVVEAIAVANSALRKDVRHIDLCLRWNAR
jgi:hypothetical protein